MSGTGGAFPSRKPAPPRLMDIDDDDNDDEELGKREEIVAIEGRAIQGAKPPSNRGPRVIPLQNNPNPVPYRKKTSNLASIAEAAQSVIGDRFNIEKMELSAEEPKKETVYGLVIRKADGEEKSIDVKAETVSEQAPPGDGADMPILLRNRNAALDHITDEEEKFKADVACRPDEANQDAYEATPVEEYGEALMRGMGWQPGAPIGVSNPAVVLPMEYVKRHHRLGLGATPKAPPESGQGKESDKKKKIIKPGESRDPKPMLVVQRDADGHQRHYRTLDEKLVPFQASDVVTQGSFARVVGGPHEGITGKVTLLALREDRAVLRLANGEDVQVLPSQLRPASSVSSSNTSMPPPTSSTGKRKSEATSAHQQPTQLSGWVRPNLVVKIVSKTWKEGRYYQKKAKVLDVPTAGECTLRLVDDTRVLLERVPESAVQTVVPRVGERVMVLCGSQKGKVAGVVEIADKRDEVVVQMTDELDLRTYLFDEVCAISLAA